MQLTVQNAGEVLNQFQSSFDALLSNDSKALVDFKKEALFAMQALTNNSFLLSIANQNPQSLKNAILNIASIGISLNPIKKHAYLIPRKGSVCLDISYLGCCEIAVSSGSVKFVQAKIVREKDRFEVLGISQEPIHQYQPFGDRGEVVGVYCVAKIHDNTFLTETMSINDVYAIRDRSESFKKKSGPWFTDEEEMIKKTVIRRASKLWPRVDINDRLDLAVAAIDEIDGIDFSAERAEKELETRTAIINEREAARVEREMCIELSKVCIEKLNTKLKDVPLKEKALFLSKIKISKPSDLANKSSKEIQAIIEIIDGN